MKDNDQNASNLGQDFEGQLKVNFRRLEKSVRIAHSLENIKPSVLKEFYQYIQLIDTEVSQEKTISRLSDFSKVRVLTQVIELLSFTYYRYNFSLVSDKTFDFFFDRLHDLEKQYPYLKPKNSPTERIGSDVVNTLEEVHHQVPVLSLDKVYNLEEFKRWLLTLQKKLDEPFELICDHKIDGISCLLTYKNGFLQQALTRGDGVVGNDITQNIKTLPLLPLRLPEAYHLLLRGEVFMNLEDFAVVLHKKNYANPRNMVSGVVRRLYSQEVREYPLQILVYEVYFGQKEDGPFLDEGLGIISQKDLYPFLEQMNFPFNQPQKLFNEHQIQEFLEKGPFSVLGHFIYEQQNNRAQLPYEIDGLVFKVNAFSQRRTLSVTDHHPRWAMAYKFTSPSGQSIIKDIVIQVGRTGRITPVALLEPVSIAGSIVSRATLHNQDYINLLNLAQGDKVTVVKRGDVIPAVENLAQKLGKGRFLLPKRCPSCSSFLTEKGAHLFCLNSHCQQKQIQRLIFFCAKNQMNIRTLGKESLHFLFEKGYLRNLESLYHLPYELLVKEPGFGIKKVALIEQGILESKNKSFERVLMALGIEDVGKKVVEQLLGAGFHSVDQLIEVASLGRPQVFSSIQGIGKQIADSLIFAFSDPQWLHTIQELKKVGLSFSTESQSKIQATNIQFQGQVWVITGTFIGRQRTELETLIRLGRGRISSSVSTRTTHLLVGENPGSKLEKARTLSVTLVSLQEFEKLLEN